MESRLVASREAASGGTATPSLIFHDAVENPVSANELSYAMDSYLQTRDIEVKENISPPAQNPNGNDLNETTLIIPTTEVDRRSREIRNLGPVNYPGLSELAPLKPTRSRSPSYQKAKTIYDEALISIKEELDEFNAQNYDSILSENMPSTDIRPRYRKMKMKEIVLISASEDLAPLLIKSGLIEEERTIAEDVIAIHEQVTNIKLTYQDAVSNVTNSLFGDRDMEDIELTSTPEIQPYSTERWSCYNI